MKELTGRERLLRLLRGEPIDRVPVSPRIHEFFVCEFFNDPTTDFVKGAIDVYRHFRMDIIDWNCTPSPHFEMEEFVKEGPHWKPVTQVRKEGATTHHVTTVKTPGGELRRVFTVTQMTPFEREAALTEHPIKTEKDWDLLEKYMPPPYQVDCASIRRTQEYIGDDGITSLSYAAPFNILAYCYRKVDDLLLDAHLNYDFYRRMLEYMTSRILNYTQQFIDAKSDMFDLGTNMANSRLVGVDFWEQFVIPYDNIIAEYAQSRGVPCLFHNCGYAAGHLKSYGKLKFKLWGYMAPPPHGDTLPEEAARLVPRDMILWGGIDQIDFLRQATPVEIDAKVKSLMDIMKPRGNYILGTTDYLETHTPYENIEALVTAGRKYGRYENFVDEESRV
jgi:uroporphyrinogen decarboxylase